MPKTKKPCSKKSKKSNVVRAPKIREAHAGRPKPLVIESPIPLIEPVADVVIDETTVLDEIEVAEVPLEVPSEAVAESPVKVKRTPVKTIFDLGEIDDALNGTPKEVQKELDGLALWMQKHPTDDIAFAKIHAYVHKYLLGLVFKKFSFVRGHDENDVYQESLIAISKKAIPKFNPNKGMSFLNFAKMCINRHLITILHASNHRRKDMPINQAISLDACPMDSDEGNCLLSNVITDDKHSAPPYKEMANRESYLKSLTALKSKLSKFEIVVLEQYLMDRSYKDAAKSISKAVGGRYNEKSVDNALLRIRKKATELLTEFNEDILPIMF